jgi:hypothetical protein
MKSLAKFCVLRAFLFVLLALSPLGAHAQFGTSFSTPVTVTLGPGNNSVGAVTQGGAWIVTAVQPTGSNFHTVCDSGCGGASTFGDNQAFTAGTTPINVTGGWYSSSITNCTSGSACAPQLSIDRKLFVQAYQGTSPWVVSGTFWQTTQPVSGTFWQATQPVSIASMPSTPVTGTFWQTTQPVSGAFWQTTQPVSIASMPSTPVTGTFWQTTQPVSGTIGGGSNIFEVSATTGANTKTNPLFNAPSDGTNVITAAISAWGTPPTGTEVEGVNANLVALPTLTKGTQGSTGMSVQELKDGGRTQVTLYVDSITTLTTEALATLNITKGVVVQSTATSYTVTAGKTLRIQHITVTMMNSAAGAVTVRLRLRSAASSISATSPVVSNLATGCPAVIAQAGYLLADFPDGLEIAGGTQIALSHLASSVVTGNTATGAGVSFALVGYEY